VFVSAAAPFVVAVAAFAAAIVASFFGIEIHMVHNTDRIPWYLDMPLFFNSFIIIINFFPFFSV